MVGERRVLFRDRVENLFKRLELVVLGVERT
jgi:hypothetical protein